MTPTASLEEAWHELPAVARAPYALLPIVETTAGHLYAGVDDLGRRLLLVPAPEPNGHLPGPFPVLHLQRRNILIDGFLRPVLVIRCEDRLFWQEFMILADEVVEGVGEAPDPAASATRVIERWRRLLSVARTDRLGLAQRMGLFAELSILKALMAHRPSLGTSV